MSKKSNYILVDEITTDDIINKFKENTNYRNIVVTKQYADIALFEFEMNFYKYEIKVESNEITTESQLKKIWTIINISCYALAIIFITFNVIYPIIVCIIITLLMYVERKDFDEFIMNNFKILNL